ncbi:LysR family transcriptional regulator [Verticiella sediminum]|uniref:LysR family transcriptional regulator n=1 Tax=Verticiella sediminum TaxID=1247510 RepID=A0A556AW85_9BURK|nr:LysR substrate-binding domain-containing protein [Verticiella sediminum]TSH96625.1 LysR family transcriptional regulator [Verticiella sediminum]
MSEPPCRPSAPAPHPSVRRPALRSLTSFEAAARLGSFQAAATELRLTASAVSHQIITLEDLLGIQLFARVGRGIQLTTPGEQYLQKVRQVLAILDDASRTATQSGATEVVRVHTPPSFASKWLLRHLPAFLLDNPTIDVRVNAESKRTGFSWSVTDLAVLYTGEPKREPSAITLLEDTVQPMCSPKLLTDRPVGMPRDLLNHTLIHTRGNVITWKEWFAAQDLTAFGRHERLQIDPSHIAIDAAIKEFGVVLESEALVQDELASGRLVTLLPETAMGGVFWMLSWTPGERLRPAAARFRDWLKAAAADSSGG